jgi:hypothetical protein
MTELWHYTCAHAAARIHGHLDPGGLGLIWATDLDVPDRAALGLSSTFTPCDRTERRFRVLDVAAFEPFATWWPGRFHPSYVSAITHPPCQPRHWWVASFPVRVEAA